MRSIRAVLSGAVAVLLLAPVLVFLSAPPAAAANLTADLVRTVQLSAADPPMPDPSGITYLPGRDRLLISDAEVDEVSVFEGANLFEITRAGVVQNTGLSTAYTKEPAGVGFNPVNEHLFVSDDDQFRVYELAAGADGRYGTSDDVRTTFSTAGFLSQDPEEIEYFPPTGELFVLDGADNNVHRVSPGLDGLFNGVAPAGDDVDTEFDIGRYGVLDPEGIGFHPGRNTMMVVDSYSNSVYEFNRNLMLVNKINISASNEVFVGGVTVAPATADPSQWNLYLVDRGVDNDTNPAENDGKLYEMSVALPPIPNLVPVVSAGADKSTHVGAPVALRAEVWDDGPSTSVGWQLVSGPGTVTFGTPAAAETAATFSAPGTYVVRASGSDSALTGSDDVRVTVVAAGGALPLDVSAVRAFDDVEQKPTGFADWASSTLNLPNAGATAQTIGLRFDDVDVPDGATITEAWIQFTSSGSNSGATSMQVAGIAENDTALFTVQPTTVSARPKTQARATWAPPAWSGSGQSGAAQRTSDLRTLVQEVLNRPGWNQGNAVGFVLTGTGERRAASTDGSVAPVLHLAYTVPAGNTAPVAAFTSSCGALSCAFDGSGSSDAEGPIASYAWTFGDGGTGTGVAPNHTYATAGTYTVTLTVTDGGGLTHQVSHPVTVAASAGIGYRAATGYVGNATMPTVTVPGGVQAGDSLLLFASVNANTTAITGPPGWTQLANVVNSSQRTLAWWKPATAADAGTPVRLTFDVYTKVTLQLAAYSGSTAQPVVTTRAETTVTTSHATPTATINTAGSWLVSYWADKSSTTTNWTAPGSTVTRDERIGSGSGRTSALLADSGAPVPNGPAGGLTATTDVASRATTLSVVLTP
ncbi:PKD domain-containing protein [Kribbella sp. NPDC051770]|uniref:PKD domain-containing protein n=1 Tax=Kribbella sp. NPDC051770 TaxID=3155413 RepID=UPI003412A115